MKRLVPAMILEHFKRQEFSGRFDAAAMSVDMSGFTALTETLMQHEQVGAEHLSQVLNQLLSPLIGEVHARGGFTATFAGDSITALFPLSAAENAAHRALQTARSAQRSFAENRIVQTPVGSFRMGVRIGLSLGTVNWGIPGTGSKYSYYFRGPGIEGCAQALAHSRTGGIIVTAEFLNALQCSITTVPADGFHRIADLNSEPGIPEEPCPERYAGELPSSEELGRFVLDRVLDLMNSGATAEFRSVTATFISFEDSMDDREMNRFVSGVLELSEEYGGYFNKLLFGEKGAVILVLFGAPQTHENDCTRTADFILALRQRELRVPWMAGSAFGTVYAGLIGCEERCEYTAIGDVVNLAARIAQQKVWGEFRMNRELADRLQATHALELVDTFSFKGKQAPMSVYRLTYRKQHTGSSFYSGLMVGRSQELNRLQDWTEPIFEGRSAGIMHICGDAGLGKSRLAEEFRRRLSLFPKAADARPGKDPGREVQWFQCPADEILRKSLNPFRHFLRCYFHQQRNQTQEVNLARFSQVLDDLSIRLISPEKPQIDNTGEEDELVSELERTRSFLGALVDLHWPDSLYARLEPKLRYPNTLAALKTLFKAESLSKPVILLMEDIQWLDADSMELLQLLTRNVADFPLAVICTARYGDDGGHVELKADPDVPRHTMELQPLEDRGVRALGRQLLGAGISSELSAFVLEKTAGNPFFIEQLLLDLRERGVLKRRPGEPTGEDETEGSTSDGAWMLDRAGSEIPTGIGAVLLARLDRLAARVRHTVQTASVLGREFTIKVLSRMLGEEEMLPENVKQAESARIWTAVNEFRYLFRHALLRDAAYQMQLHSRLQSLHRLAAEAMEQEYEDDLSPHYSELAYHFGTADDRDRERFYAELAGRQAADAFANQEALSWLDRALELTPESQSRFDLMATRERVYDLLGMRSEQAEEIENMKNLAEVLDDLQLKALAVLRRGQFASDTSDFPAAIEAARRCIALAELKLASPQLVATGVKAHNVWGISLMSQGSFEQALEQLEQALGLAEDIDAKDQQVTILGNLGMLHALRGSFDQARTCWNRGLDICSETDDLLHETAIFLNLGNVAFSQGELASAGSNWKKALSIFRQIGYRTGAAHALLNLGVLAYQLGSYVQAKDYYEQALAITREIVDRQTEGKTLGNLGSILTQLGEYSEARDRFLEALHIRRGIGDHQGEGIVLGYLCHLDRLSRDYRSAEKYGQESLTITRDIGDRPYQARTLYYLGNLFAEQDRLGEAEDAYRKSLALLKELGQDGPATESLAGLARVAMAGGRAEEALTFVEDILEYLESNSLDSTTEPFAVYLACCDVLRANDDPRGADILSTAVSILRERAGRIQDERLRLSFLQKAAANRRIMELEHTWNQEPDDPR